MSKLSENIDETGGNVYVSGKKSNGAAIAEPHHRGTFSTYGGRAVSKNHDKSRLCPRQTFYSLFENKEEVIGRRLDRLFEEYRKRFIAEKRAYTIRSLCDSIMECFVEQKKLLSLLVENRLDTLAREKSEAYLLHLDNIFHAYDHEDRDYAISFLAGAIISMVVYAIRKNDFTDSRKISNLVQKIITGHYFTI